MQKLKLAILASGGGTTMQAIIKACKSGELSGIDPVLVISDREGAGALQKAQDEGIKAVFVRPRKAYPSLDDYGVELLRLFHAYNVDLIGQYGWLTLTPANVVSKYEGQMVNQHPGPLDTGYPDFGGKGMYGRAVHAARLIYARSVEDNNWTEATAHLVTPEFDKGAVIMRKRVPIEPDDTVDILQAKVLPVEHTVQIEALKLFALGQIVPLVREQRLIDPQHIEFLDDAKKIAISEYPNG